VNIQYLRNFYVITKFGSFTRAAEAVHRTQSTLSSQIKNLEEELGVSLFERSGRQSVILTPEGEALLEFTKRLLVQYDELELRLEEIQSSAMQEAGRLRIGAAPSVIDDLLLGSIPKFQELHPQVRMQVYSRPPAEVVELVKEGFLDVGISLDAAIPKNFESCQWIPLRLTLMVPKEHPLSSQPDPDMDEILKYPFIIPSNRRFLTRILYDQQIMERGIEPNIVMESDYNVTHARYVRAGFGISFMYISDETCQRFSKKICCINLDKYAPPLYLKIFYRQGSKLNVVNTFTSFMKSLSTSYTDFE